MLVSRGQQPQQRSRQSEKAATKPVTNPAVDPIPRYEFASSLSIAPDESSVGLPLASYVWRLWLATIHRPTARAVSRAFAETWRRSRWVPSLLPQKISRPIASPDAPHPNPLHDAQNACAAWMRPWRLMKVASMGFK